MKNWILPLAFLAGSADAAIIAYDFSHAWVDSPDGSYSSQTSSTFTLDTSTDQISDLLIQSDSINGYSTESATIAFDLIEENWGIVPGSSLWGASFLLPVEFTMLNGQAGTFSGLLESNIYTVYAPIGADPSLYMHHDDGGKMELSLGDSNYWFTPLGGNPTIIDTGEEPSEVPEPASIALLGLGLAGLAWRRYS